MLKLISAACCTFVFFLVVFRAADDDALRILPKVEDNDNGNISKADILVQEVQRNVTRE